MRRLRRWWRLSLAWDQISWARIELREHCPCCICRDYLIGR